MAPLQAGRDDFLATIGAGGELALHLAMQEPCTKRRKQLENFIGSRFAEQYGARVRHFMPCLLGLYDDAQQLQAALGVRCGQQGALFLEHYLDAPVEQCIAELAGGAQPSRGRIAEVGNLAAIGAGHARLLIVALTDLLASAGFRWVAFTGTPVLLNSFQRLGLSLLHLGAADGRRLGDELADWGSYYATQPQVMVGDVLAAHQRLQALGIYRRLGYQARHALDGEFAHVACG
ncbi:thermostable hemolysin [Pseudomonas oryzae]|uniref:Thermostable hemolysin n=1 Tax=Pseudomonas oryzae TaxID=1392877 RepID=A0A1H1UTY4_9PSED|nr:thermostable hemolysin [Pseudomonas oryzae]SDS75947.1 Thermostable hemolysin [Pseudomonas oryzae]